ncbi:TadE/TadG family type IV pilus assembly protein [Granulicella aggregans]|uniref:TadE/TadG family type IV pilus assembly protein n=1 Tax=Granulicella aggregans TaxID=474949 RepID=UPI0021E033F2|nr:TadE/TadG family type IV pilus assembly protein [Granulicella aggregans]
MQTKGTEVTERMPFWSRKQALLSLRSDQKAQSLIEFAFILPVFLLVVTGMFAFGVAFTNWMVLTDATSLGGRTVSISRGNTLDPCSTASTAVAGAAPGLNTSQITYSSVINGTTYSGTSCNSSSTTTGAAGNLVQGGYYILSTTYPCKLAVFGQNLVSNCTLHASVKELVQ